MFLLFLITTNQFRDFKEANVSIKSVDSILLRKPRDDCPGCSPLSLDLPERLIKSIPVRRYSSWVVSGRDQVRIFVRIWTTVTEDCRNFFSLSRQIPGYYLKVGHDRFLPTSFTTYCSLIVLSFDDIHWSGYWQLPLSQLLANMKEGEIRGCPLPLSKWNPG
jgi:hypothetical protein